MSHKIEKFIEELAITQVPHNVYNQYAYFDTNEAAYSAIRRNNLLIYLRTMQTLKPKVMLVGEAPGYRGCRLTGVPFTSEFLLMNNMQGMNLFGREAGYELASAGSKLLKEATATIIWETLIKYDIQAVAWNAFPFHPHREGNYESNRMPTKTELLIGEKALLQMKELFKIDHIVAVGNKAEETLKKLGMNVYKVRHPAQGGKNDFVQGIKSIKERLS